MFSVIFELKLMTLFLLICTNPINIRNDLYPRTTNKGGHQNTRWKCSTFKAMLGSISAPNSGSFVEKNKKIIGSQMEQTDNKTF